MLLAAPPPTSSYQKPSLASNRFQPLPTTSTYLQAANVLLKSCSTEARGFTAKVCDSALALPPTTSNHLQAPSTTNHLNPHSLPRSATSASRSTRSMLTRHMYRACARWETPQPFPPCIFAPLSVGHCVCVILAAVLALSWLHLSYIPTASLPSYLRPGDSELLEVTRYHAPLENIRRATRTPSIACVQGTLTHMAPEILLTGQQSNAGDVYAFAITLFELYTGGTAFKGIPPVRGG